MSFVEVLQRTGRSAADLKGAHGVVISPDGQHVYAATDVTYRFHTFGRDLDTGALTYLETFTDSVDGVDGLENAWLVAVSPDYSLVSVTSFDDSVVTVFG